MKLVPARTEGEAEEDEASEEDREAGDATDPHRAGAGGVL